MKVVLYKRFEKELSKIKDKKLALAVKIVIDTVMEAQTPAQIPHLKKLTGDKTAYRIRVGDHRIGVFIHNDKVEFAAFDHRKDIYKKFP